MKYTAVADTDIGTHKAVNQDSTCIKLAETPIGIAALVMVCDGMGGLDSGELASAEAVNTFSDWFDNELPYETENWNWNRAAVKTIERLEKINEKLIVYGKQNNIKLGTTASGILAIGKKYLTFHVGDTRIYKVNNDELSVLTEDHSFVYREVKMRRMTVEEARLDPRRNALLQCLGASGGVNPDIKLGNLEVGANYMICSDGFRHVLSPKEIFTKLNPSAACNDAEIKGNIRDLIETVKLRHERDNITALVFRADL
ncbi:MAG: serine/threonine-protein phosphatase [Ruminococcus sp.]|nr:serine/threonine-protein phosphatase [Ruminococcus sp.]